MYIENRDIDIIENKYSSLPICSRLSVHRVGSNLRRSARFFFRFFPSLCFLFHFSRLFFNNPPILSLSRIDQNPADRIKSISSSAATDCRPSSVFGFNVEERSMGTSDAIPKVVPVSLLGTLPRSVLFRQG